MKEPINFAVIGCGMMAMGQHIPNLARSSRTVLHTCCDLSDDALAECRDKHGAQHTTTDYLAAANAPEVQAICLATTQALRLPVIEAAAKLGKPVYCEKPLAASLEEMYEIQNIVNDSGIPFCVGHNRRSSPAMIDAHRIFRNHMTNPAPCPWRFDREGDRRPRLKEDGVAGISVRVNDDWYSWKGWAYHESTEAGPLLFEMTHFTDLCNWFLAAEPEEVVAMASGMLNHGVIVRYKSGELATLSICDNGTFGYPKELLEVFGNGGAVIVDHMLEVRTGGIENAAPRTLYPMTNDRYPEVGREGGVPGWLAKQRAVSREAVERSDTSLICAANPDKGHAHAIDRFVDEILGKGPVVCGVADAVLATRVAFAAIKSSHEHRLVKVAEV